MLYVDLQVINDDLTLDSGGEPVLLGDRESIAQDIKHLIRESGLMIRVVGQRDPALVKALLLELELLVEDDVRLVPGTVAVTQSVTELFFVVADTEAFGPISFAVGV